MKIILKILEKIGISHIFVTLLAFSLMLFFAAVAMNVNFFDTVKKAINDVSIDDIYYSILKDSEPEISNSIVMIDITEVYDRKDFADLINQVEDYGAKCIGIDCVFEREGNGTPESNEALLNATMEHNNIVFSLKLAELDNDNVFQRETHSFMFMYVDSMAEGFTNMPRKLYGGLKRVTPMVAQGASGRHKSFAAHVAEKYAGKDFTIDHPEELNINFSPTIFPSFLPKDVKKNKELFKDKIVLFAALKQEEDYHWTPIGKIAGTELLAYSIQTVLEKKEVKSVSMVTLCIISFLMVLLVQIIQQWYLNKMATYRNPFVRYIIGSTYVLNILTFLFTAVFIWISFLVFQKFNLSINVTWGIAGTAFLTTSRNMYKALKDYYFNKDNK